MNDPKRIQILYALADKPHTVTELTQALDLPQSTVSRHLSILRERSIVETERDGTSIVCSVNNPLVMEILGLMWQLMREVVEQQADVLDS